ncbi:hypothetical protein [Compostibacter hankyongensis]|uniref:Uncharacterized protein n=1 Tax=Compostibacter hankyongensis TaxID=1007089 RepID=A0ABP8FW70_9BACT
MDMETAPELKEVIDVWKNKFSRRNITQQDIDWLNAVSREYKDVLLNAIPESEDVFRDLCIDEDINGALFFVKES